MGDRLHDAPIGTKAPAITGGRWYRTEHGWKWNGPEGSGGTFPRPGADWDNSLIYPDGTRSLDQQSADFIAACDRIDAEERARRGA